MLVALDLSRSDADLVLLPEGAEFLALGGEQLGEPSGLGFGSAKGEHPAQPGDVHPRVELVVLAAVEVARRRVGEPPVSDAARRAGVPAQVADERDAERGLPQRLPQLGDDLRGGVGEPVEDPQHAGADVIGARAAGRGLVPGEAEEVVALVERKMQPLGD